jgi:hypothetical protein
MIKHIVFFKLKDFAEGAPKPENARKIKQQLDNLAAQVPGVERLEVGINFVQDPMAFDIALYAEFVSRAALDAYQQHPEHRKIVQFIGKVRDQRVVVDYEV